MALRAASRRAEGFLRVLDDRTVAFADFAGNAQFVSTGNLETDDRVALFLMDYPNQARLKVIGHARSVEGDGVGGEGGGAGVCGARNSVLNQLQERRTEPTIVCGPLPPLRHLELLLLGFAVALGGFADQEDAFVFGDGLEVDEGA